MSKRAGGTFVAEAAAAMPRGGAPDERCPSRRARSVTGSAEAWVAAAQRAPQTKKQLRRRRKVFFAEG
ncbi:hypothetical protein F260042K2_07260 [Flavonifractor plautii]